MYCTFFNAVEGAPQLSVDLNAATSAIDSLYSPQKDSIFTVGIYITNIENLYSYQLYIQFDTTRLRYVSSSKGNTTAPHFMEQNEKSITPKINLSANRKDRILVAAYYTGDIPGASGSGYLGVVSFRRLSPDSTAITLLEPIFITPTYDDITINAQNMGKILPPGSIPVRPRVQSVSKSNIQIINKTVHCTLPIKSSAQIRLLDISGRCILQRNNLSKQITFNIPQTCSGVFVLSITHQNGTIVHQINVN